MKAVNEPDIWPEIFAGFLGGEWDVSKVLDIGALTIKLERAFNKAAGFTEKDDRLPEFFYKEQAEASGEVYDITPEELAKAYSE
jgi:aldehyde:ferredoxin oxidoreductase